MTDLQKYENFFNEMKISYKIAKRYNWKLVIEVSNEHISGYGNSLYIAFDKNEKFIEFECFGE